MAEINCSACEELRQEAPQLACNGFDDSMCTSLQNDTGLVASSGNNDCTDLNNLNDCLVGNQETEVDLYEVCDWKAFMKQFIPNLWTTTKALICAICGIWTNIHNLWNLANRIDCIVDYMTQGASFTFGEYTSSGNSYIVAGKGVSFANVSASGTANDITITYVSGGMSYLSGSCMFYDSDFTDRQATANYDNNGVDPTTSASRRGNTIWNTSGYLDRGGELVYELRIKKSEYPQIERFWNGLGNPGAGGAYDAIVVFRNEGTYAPGQHGWCDTTNGDPIGNSDRGHLVPSGWMYIQVRLKELRTFSANGTQFTPVCIVPIRINQSGIGC